MVRFERFFKTSAYLLFANHFRRSNCSQRCINNQIRLIDLNEHQHIPTSTAPQSVQNCCSRQISNWTSTPQNFAFRRTSKHLKSHKNSQTKMLYFVHKTRANIELRAERMKFFWLRKIEPPQCTCNVHCTCSCFILYYHEHYVAHPFILYACLQLLKITMYPFALQTCDQSILHNSDASHLFEAPTPSWDSDVLYKFKL